MKQIKNKLELKINELGNSVVQSVNPEGFWDGRLSSSALGGAVAVAALWFDNPEKNAREINLGLDWLRQTINANGSYGDTPESPGNISTSLLVYATFNLFSDQKDWIKSLQNKIAKYLNDNQVDTRSPQVAQTILDHYKDDFTFSVPILALCGVCGVPGKSAFSHIPQAPFELALLPRSFYRILNLSVVSYAIPALISVGILIFKKKNSNFLWKTIRHF
ncbi:MAG: hypothetical protein PHS40_11495, partial [Mariniphaga sp.]|nr:hypothetical protein [Mariniphaga sp.]